MGDFKTICIFENLPISAYFFKRREDFSCLLKNPIFSNIIPRAKHVLNTFELIMLCARLYLFVIDISFAPVISTSIHRYVNNSPDIKVLMKVIETETLTRLYITISSSTWIIVFLLSSYIYIYIYIYIY